MAYTREQLINAINAAAAAGDGDSVRELHQHLQAIEQQPNPGTDSPNPGMGLQQRFVNWVGDAVKGNAAEELPNINQAGMDTFGTGMASMFGSDEDYVNALKREGYQITQDANGNPVAVGPDGQRAYVNQPGLDPEDVTRFAGKALSFTPAGKLAQAPATILGKVGTMAAGSAATDVGMQLASGRDSVDPIQATTTALAGAGGELVAPVAGKVGRTIADWLRKSDFSPEAGRQALLKAGATADDVAGLPDALLAKVARQGVHVDDSVRWQARVAEAQGLKPTRAQQTDQGWRLHEQAAEMDDTLRNFQNERVKGMAQGEATALGGQGSAIRAQEAAMQGIGSEARRRAAQVDDAYDVARSHKGGVAGESLAGGGKHMVEPGQPGYRPLTQRTDEFQVQQGMRETPTKRDLFGGTFNAMDDIRYVAAQADELMKQPGAVGVTLPFDEVEMVRRGLLKSRSAAKNPDDARMVGDLIKRFDDWFAESIDRGLFEGSPDFLNAVKDARRLNAKFKNDFAERWMRHGTDRIGKTLEQLRLGEISVDQASNIMLGASSLKPAVALEYARRLKGVVPPETFNAFKEAAFRKLLTNARTGEAFDERTLLNNLKGVLNEDGAYYRLFKELLTGEERSRLHAMATGLQGLLRQSVSSREAGRSSGTAERVIGWMMNRTGQGNLLSVIPEILRNRQAQRYAKQGLLQNTLPGQELLPAAAAAAGTY